jgi:hypothetical protein
LFVFSSLSCVLFARLCPVFCPLCEGKHHN